MGDTTKYTVIYWNVTKPNNINARVIVEGYNIKKQQFPDDERIPEYDIFMVTGSATNAYDDSIEWVRRLHGFLRHLIADFPKVKLVGICFGHQIVSRALGGSVEPSGQWEIGPTPIDLTDMGKSIFGVEQLTLQEMHRDHVTVESLSKQLASGELQLLGHTDVTGNQGFVRFYPTPSDVTEGAMRTAQDIHILTLQAHPEFFESISTGIIRQRAEDGAMDAETVFDYWGERGADEDEEPEDKSGTGRRWRKTDGKNIVSKVLWNMIGVSA